MQYYCIHHKDSVDRKKFIITNYVNKYNLNIKWIEDFLPTSDFILNHKKIYSNHAANKSYLNNNELSCYLKHQKAISLISNSNDYGMILEDDIAEVSFDFTSTIDILYNDMINNNCDILFIGSFFIYDLQNINNQPYIYCNKNTLSRCAHAYIISDRCASKILDYISDIKAPFDWQLNFAINNLNLNSCWSYPHIYQRTEKKQIESLLRN